MKQFELIDTHCHLYLEEFSQDLPACLTRAEMEGVSRFYLPSLDSHHLPAILNLEKSYPGKCFSMAGIHPCYVKENVREELDYLQEALSQHRFVAIGEIGLDFYWDLTFEQDQIFCFREQIKLAKAHALPIVIHSRNSMQECINILREEKDERLKGIFHCFSGNAENAREIVECGLLLGIGGVVTYKNAGLAETVADIPLEHLVLETDAPYLTPVPFRGKRNESSYLKYIAEKIALVKALPVEEVARITTANALRVFGEV